ncbi:outer membrane beta-barrel protein [Mangrovimonas aestuarii]|uniref:outer membrane beta-barrel protein n=1 Tax=Mangrovimonas aestuarii TaxID=3018443 RepID=UPI00237898C7|nr:DUF481 domain-containing protein [Mangrovimonas aestuarii]
MNLTLKQLLAVIFLSFVTAQGFAQASMDEWKLQVALGVNHPFGEGYTNGFYSQDVNFPTIQLGVQHLFTEKIGVRADLGYNRFKNLDAETSPEFKANYTNLNVHFVYDVTEIFQFMLPRDFSATVHIGPGYTFTKPLGKYADNNENFANLRFGGQLHYAVSRSVTVFMDGSYIYSFGERDYRKNSSFEDGFAVKGDLVTASVGVSISVGSDWCKCY